MSSKPRIVFRQCREEEANVDVTVVIPAYNAATTLGQELDALVAQEADIPIEVLISDNGSSDNTREVAMKWAGRFAAFTIVDSRQLQGVSHARNEGARAAVGGKVLICDADDVVSPQWVKSLSEGLDKYDAVGGAARLDRLNPPEVVRGQPNVTEGLNRIFGFLPYALGGSFGIKREVLVAVGGFDSSYRKGHEEADFCWRLQLAGYTLGWCPEGVVDYRQRADSYQAACQHFNYAKSSMLLWCRYAPTHPLRPVSFRASARRLAAEIVRSFRLLSSDTRWEHARTLGWCAGVLAGHLEYRVFGSAPAPILITDVPGIEDVPGRANSAAGPSQAGEKGSK